MDKKKIISSLTVAGMLGAVAASTVNAATTDDSTKTEALGVYSNLIEGKKIVPFILQSESDRATVGDLKAKYPTAVISGSDNTVLKTGDTFTLNGITHEVLVYGDVYADGEVDIFDAMEVIRNIKGEATLSDIQKLAANVNNKEAKDIDIFDAMNVVSAIKGGIAYAQLTTAPTGSDEEKKDDEKKDETKASGKLEKMEIYANNNVTNLDLEFSALAEGYDYVIHNDTDDEEVKWSKAETNQDKVTITTTKKLAEKNKNGNAITYSITVVDENGAQVAKQTFQVRDNVSTAKNVAFTDSKYSGIVGSNIDELSLKVEVDKDVDYNSTVTITLSDGVREAKGTGTLAKNTKVATITNWEGVKDLDDTTTQKPSLKVLVEVKDEYGNITKAWNSTYNSTNATLKDSQNANLVISKNTAEFKITSISAKRVTTDKATVTMLLNDKVATSSNQILKQYYVVKNANESAPSQSDVLNGKVIEYNANGNRADYTFDVEIKDGVSSSEYAVYVVAEKPNGDQSEVSRANITKIGAKKLSTVSDIQKAGEFGKFRWNDNSNKKENPNDVAGYKVILYATTANDSSNSNGRAIASKDVTDTNVDLSKEIKEFASDENNSTYTKYYITVSAVAKNGLEDSEFKGATKLNNNNQEVSDTSVYWQITQLGAPTFDANAANVVKADEEKGYDLVLYFNEYNGTTMGTKANVSMYEVAIYKVDKDGNRAKNPTNKVTVPTTAGKDGVDLTSLLFKGQEKGKYEVTVKALAFETGEYINSEEAETLGTSANKVVVYYVDAPKNLELTVKDNTTLKISATEIPEIYSADTTSNVVYKAYIRKKTQANSEKWSNAIELTDRAGTVVSKEITSYTIPTTNGTTPKNVEANTRYEVYVVAEFKIVANANTSGLEIARTGNVDSTTSSAPLKLLNGNTNGYKKVIYDNKQINAKEISNNGSILLINDATDGYRRITSDNGYTNFKDILDIVQIMSSGDEIRSGYLSGNTVMNSDVITLTKNETGGEFGNTLKDAKLVINADSIALTANSVKKVEIANNSNISRVYLGGVNVGEDGVKIGTNVKEIEVMVGTKVIFDGDNTVKINGVYINAKDKTEVTATGDDELTIKGVKDTTVKVISDVDKNKTVKFTNSQKEVNAINMKSGRTLTLDGAIVDLTVGKDSTAYGLNSSVTLESKGIVNVSNVGYNTLKLVDVNAKVAISGVEKDIYVDANTTYTIKPENTMYVEKIANTNKLQVSGVGKVEFASGSEPATLASEKQVEISVNPKTINGITVSRDSSTVKYEVTDGKAYIHLIGNGKATLTK